MSILLYAQLTPEKNVHEVFFELATKSKHLSQKLGNCEINAVVLSDNETLESIKSQFNKVYLNKVYCFTAPELKNYSTINFSKLIINLSKEINPQIILIGATTQGRDLAPRIAASLHTGLTADCTELDIDDNSKLLATRPTFGGQLMATIMCKTLPQMATVRPNVFEFKEQICENIEFIDKEISTDTKNDNVKILETTLKQKCQDGNFENADIIVAGGKGLKNQEGFALLKKFANSIGACVGATRGAVEKGLAPAEIQIGQTGKTVTPNIYIAFGISGAIQHTVGMENSNYIVAVNNDKNAQIFQIADAAIVGDAIEILEQLVKR